MTPHRYPWRVEPGRNESLPSMLERLSVATGLTIRELYPHGLGTLADGPDRGCLQQVAAVLGHRLDDVRRRTLRDRLGARFETFGLDDVRPPTGLRCPGCGTAPVWSRLVLVTTCTDCGLLLTGGREPIPAPAAAMDIQRCYLASLRRHSDSMGDRFRRLWRLIKLCRCIGWQPTSAEALGTITGPTIERTSSGWKSPAWIAAVAEQAWPQTVSGRTTRSAIGDFVLDHLGQDSHDGLALEAERVRLHHELRRWDLTVETIPDYLHADVPLLAGGCHNEEIGSSIARALSREALHAFSGLRPTITAIDELHGDTDDRRTATALTRVFGDTTAGIRILRREATALAAQPRCDYRERRTALRSLRSVPAPVLMQAGLVREPQTARLAAAWIWLELTHGTLRAGPHRAGLRTTLRTFDRRLRPEARLALLDYGASLLNVVATDVTWDARIHREPPAISAEARSDAG